MVGYTPPIADMRFVLDTVCDLAGVAKLPGFEETTPELVDHVLEQAGKLAADVWAPLDAPGDRAGAAIENGAVRTPAGFSAAYRAFVDGGWNGAAIAPADGGMGLPMCVALAVQEMWQTANMSLALCPLLTQAAITAVSRHGSDGQKQRYLPRLVSGEWTGTMNMTEPQAGSDLGAIRTLATPENAHYRIRGQKIFITHGEHDLAENIVHMVLARTADAPAGSRGLSLFIVPKYRVEPDGTLGSRNDLRCVSLERKLGLHASPTAVMSYGDEDGAWAELIGNVGRGLPQMFAMMNDARLGIALQGVAICQRAYQSAAEFARGRVQSRPIDGGDPVAINHHPDVRRMLMHLRSHAEATRALAYYVASMADIASHHPEGDKRESGQRRVDLLTPVAKAWCTDVGVEMASLGIQVHGGMGYVEETGAAQILRDDRVTPIYEGTNGIQAIDLVGRKLLRDGGAAMRDLLDQIEREADRGSQPELHDGTAALRRASDWIVQAGRSAETFTGAVPFLCLAGAVVAGWLMARAAAAAQARLAAGNDRGALLRAKIATSRFYAEHVLSQAPALQTAIIEGAPSVLALAPDDL